MGHLETTTSRTIPQCGKTRQAKMRWFEDRLSRWKSFGNFPLASWSVAPAPVTQPVKRLQGTFRWWRFSYCKKHKCPVYPSIIVVVPFIFKFLMSTFSGQKQRDAVPLCPTCHISPASLHPCESSSILSAANPVVLMDPQPISTCPENPAWKSSVSTNKREAFPLAISYPPLGIER